MVEEATRNLRRLDPSEERFEVVHVGAGSEYRGKSPFDGIQFDMIVSEILGTLAMSENMCKHRSHVEDGVEDVYGAVHVSVVPQHATLASRARGSQLWTALRARGEHLST